MIPTDLAPRPVAQCTADEVTDVLNRCFEGYLVPARWTPDAFDRRFRAENLDGFASRVYTRGGAPAAAILVTRRGWTSRVGAMGVAPELRGTGVGRWMLAGALREARARGDRAMLLEVFEQNTPAVKLYQALGFRALRRLVGYRWEPAPAAAPAAPDPALAEVDPREVGRIVTRAGEEALPWMLEGETLSAAVPPSRAWTLGGNVFALVPTPAAERLTLGALFVPRDRRRQGWGRRMVDALRAAHPGRPWAVGQIVPEALAPGFFTATGWAVQPLNQLEMRHDLDGGGGAEDGAVAPAPGG